MELQNLIKKIIKTIIFIVIFVIALYLFYLIGTGFRKDVAIALDDYSVSEDGTQLHFKLGSWASIGYTRGFRDKEKTNVHYLTFYATFGGINSRFGAKNEFILELDEDDTEIFFFTDKGYELVLQKNATTGEWEKIP